MRKEIRTLALVVAILATSTGLLKAQDALVEVTIENIAPENGVVLTPVWVGFHSGSFDSYNGGLTSLEGLERVAEDGNNSVISQQFLDFNRNRGGYTYVDNSGSSPVSALVRTGDLTDRFRQDDGLANKRFLCCQWQPSRSRHQRNSLQWRRNFILHWYS